MLTNMNMQVIVHFSIILLFSPVKGSARLFWTTQTLNWKLLFKKLHALFHVGLRIIQVQRPSCWTWSSAHKSNHVGYKNRNRSQLSSKMSSNIFTLLYELLTVNSIVSLNKHASSMGERVLFLHKSQQVISYKTDWIISGMQAGAVNRLFYISAHYIVVTYF